METKLFEKTCSMIHRNENLGKVKYNFAKDLIKCFGNQKKHFEEKEVEKIRKVLEDISSERKQKISKKGKIGDGPIVLPVWWRIGSF